MYLYILDNDGQPVRCDDTLTWARWFESTDRTVASDDSLGCRISTVFLGIDHNYLSDDAPILWETMVFGGPLNGEQDRYASRADAVEGHQRMIDKVHTAIQNAG